MHITLKTLAAPAAVVLFAAATSQAAVLLDTSFEATETPPYALGNLDGQNGWDTFFVNNNPASFNVVDVNALTGTQAVRATGAAVTDPVSGTTTTSAGFAFNTGTALSSLTAASAEPIVTVTASVLRPTPAAGDTNVSSSYGLQLYDGNVDLLAGLFLFNNVGAAGTVGTPGTLVPAFQATAPDGTVGLFLADGAVSFGSYQELQIVLDYTTDTFNLFVNGTPTVDDTGAVADIPFITASNTFGDANLTFLGGSGDTGFFDDVSITTSAIPEPATAGLLGVAGLALLARRRRA